MSGSGRNGIRSLLRYVCKSCTSQAACKFGINPKIRGTVAGKRCGASESIIAAARHQAGSAI